MGPLVTWIVLLPGCLHQQYSPPRYTVAVLSRALKNSARAAAETASGTWAERRARSLTARERFPARRSSAMLTRCQRSCVKPAAEVGHQDFLCDLTRKHIMQGDFFCHAACVVCVCVVLGHVSVRCHAQVCGVALCVSWASNG